MNVEEERREKETKKKWTGALIRLFRTPTDFIRGTKESLIFIKEG
jgi:hypothetical protein